MNEEIKIGDYLKKIREEKNLKLSEIATKTRINLNVLKKLEDNNFKELPNITYVKGFVKNYAKALGLNQEEALHILQESTGYKEIELEAALNPPLEEFTQKKDIVKELKTNKHRERISNLIHHTFKKKTLIILGSAVILILLLKYSVNYYGQLKIDHTLLSQKVEEKPKEILEKVDEEIKKDIITETNQGEITSEIKSEVVVNDESIKNKEENLFDLKISQRVEPAKESEEKRSEEKAEEKDTSSGKYPYLKFYKSPTNLYSINKDAKENSDTSLLPENIKQGMISGKENVFIRATEGDTWLSYKIDDEKITRYILTEGRYTLLRGNVIRLFMGNINATKIFYNNELISVESKSGVKSLIFPQEKASDFVLPLFPNYKGVPIAAEDYIKNMEEP